MLPGADFKQPCLFCWTQRIGRLFLLCFSGEGAPVDRSRLMVSNPEASCFVWTAITLLCWTWWPNQFWFAPHPCRIPCLLKSLQFLYMLQVVLLPLADPSDPKSLAVRNTMLTRTWMAAVSVEVLICVCLLYM